MDSLTYHYNSGTNQLNYITDSAESWIGGYYDIHDMPTNNYGYDQIGNMVKDSIENITGIAWNVYGKITNINHSTTQWYNDALNIAYTYDAAGNRISKRITTPGTNTVNYTWYVRDASGNMMATYTGSVDSSTTGIDSLQSSSLSLENYYLYGSSRIGQYASHFSVVGDSSAANYYSPWNDLTSYWFRGEKQYELYNHLGNVLVTVSDDKIGVPKSSNSSLIDHYTPVVINAQDYYPFGMLMQGRLITSFYNYYFGFNGKEKDDEAKGSNNQVDYGARIYDPRVGRFLSVDPIQRKYAELTPYQYASNSPITFIDQDGLEFVYRMPNGSLYFPLPSDHNRTPIPSDAIPLPVYSGTHGSQLTDMFADILASPLEGVNTLINHKIPAKGTDGKTVYKKASAGDYVGATANIIFFGTLFDGEGGEKEGPGSGSGETEGNGGKVPDNENPKGSDAPKLGNNSVMM
jgi:RHS repeat-associated protein